MDGAATWWRERGYRIFPDLIVREAVVRWRAIRLLKEQPGRNRRCQRFGQRIDFAYVLFEPPLDLLQVPQTEASSEDRRFGQRRFRFLWKPASPALDKRSDRGRQ